MKERMRMLAVCICVILLLSGCSGQTGETAEKDMTHEKDLNINGKIDYHYTERDLSGNYETGETISLKDSYTISEEGVYIFNGSLNDGQIVVDTDDKAKVQIVLKGVSLSCDDGPAIYVKSADKVFLTLAEGTENVIEDGFAYKNDEDEPWGAVFSKDDLTINGSGRLKVEGNYMHGIVSKDSLKVTGGIIEVTAEEDGIRGRDEVCIHDGKISIYAKGDAIKSNNDEEDDRGNVSIDGGEIKIEDTASQGIDGYNVVQILGGTVNITSENEGIQGEKIYMKSGTLTVDAVDDCLNAKDSLIEDSEAVHEDALLEIAGGELTLSTSAGDGLDSNGNISVTGGRTVVHGSSGGIEVAMDYNGSAAITGGTVLATGANGMAQNFDSSSSQCSLMYDCSGNAGSTVSMKDGEGNEIISFEALKSFSSIIISTPEMQVGETYTLTVDDSDISVQITDTITSYSSNMMGVPGSHGGFGDRGGDSGRGPGRMPEDMGPM